MKHDEQQQSVADAARENLTIGSTVWRFEPTRRVYRHGSDGVARGNPIWREHWVDQTIVGETSRSWLVGYPGSFYGQHKLAKRGPVTGWGFSEEHVDRLAWAHEHAWKIRDYVGQLGRSSNGDEVEKLEAVARIVGYEQCPPKKKAKVKK